MFSNAEYGENKQSYKSTDETAYLKCIGHTQPQSRLFVVSFYSHLKSV